MDPMIVAFLVGWLGVAVAAEPPPGPYLQHCSSCSVTPVGTSGVMLGCLCTADGTSLEPSSLWLLGGACSVPITFTSGELTCPATGEHAAASPVQAAALEVAPVQAASVAPPPPAPVTTYGVSARPAPAPERLVASAAALPPPASRVPDAEPLEISIATWNADGRVPIRQAPDNCSLTTDGLIACICPDKAGGVIPRIARLDGPADAWTCGCTDRVGLICLPTK